MCTGKCSRCIAVSLYPLAVISIICNIVLFFPDANIKYAKDGHITEEVKYMGGLVGGGIMVSCLCYSVPEGCDSGLHAAINSFQENVCNLREMLVRYLKLKILDLNWCSVVKWRFKRFSD